MIVCYSSERRRCEIFFFDGEELVDQVKFKDVQLAAEYLTKCGYVKDTKSNSRWTKYDGCEAFVLYYEEL